MSACVPVGVYFPPCGATVTLIRPDRSTSPLALDSAVHPLVSLFAETPYPGAAVARSFKMLMLTRTTFSAYGSTITVTSPRDTTIGCACIVGVVAATNASIAAPADHPALNLIACPFITRPL
jgi:hypothetical protein